MAPRGLGIRHEDGYRQWKRNATSRVPAIVCSPAGSRRCFTSWTPSRRRKGRAVHARSLVEQRPLLNGTHFSCRWLRSSIPTDLTARSHRPRAVEHRDCPPCGGDGRIIAQVSGGGDGGFSIPQLVRVSGLIGLGLALRDSAELRAGLADPHLSSPCEGEDRWGSGSAFELIEIAYRPTASHTPPSPHKGERVGCGDEKQKRRAVARSPS